MRSTKPRFCYRLKTPLGACVQPQLFLCTPFWERSCGCRPTGDVVPLDCCVQVWSCHSAAVVLVHTLSSGCSCLTTIPFCESMSVLQDINGYKYVCVHVCHPLLMWCTAEFWSQTSELISKIFISEKWLEALFHINAALFNNSHYWKYLLLKTLLTFLIL